MVRSIKESVEEKLFNVPNTLTFIRAVISVSLTVFYILGFDIFFLLSLFIVGAITDFLDGFLARRLKQETIFGARFDIAADRLLWITFGIILIAGYRNNNYYNLFHFAMIFSRELICGGFLLGYILFLGKRDIFPSVRYSGKLLTVLQGIVIPSMILSEKYNLFIFYKYLIVPIFLIGIFCSIYYIFDLVYYDKLRKSKFVRYYNLINPIAPTPHNQDLRS